jgi:hypothetical protein
MIKINSGNIKELLIPEDWEMVEAVCDGKECLSYGPLNEEGDVTPRLIITSTNDEVSIKILP